LAKRVLDSSLPPELLELGHSLLQEAAAFPWLVPAREREPWEDMWWWWNVAFVHAAGRLFVATRILNEQSFSDEAMLPLRSMMELVANQGYMAQDPRTRAREYAEADLQLRERSLEGLVELGNFDERAVDTLRTEIADIRTEMEPLMADIEVGVSIWPFGKPASKRAAAAGLTWHYKGLYVAASDYVHMNARAVAQYLSRIQDEREEQAPRASTIVMACEFLLRSLYFGDMAVEQGRRDDLDRYARSYAAIALPDTEVGKVVLSLWPPQVRPKE
jgi:Family of unknown function (DUF5677)